MGVEKSRGQLIVDRIKNGPPIKLHKMEELDYIFNPFIERIKGEVIKSIVEKNLTSASFTCTNLCRELRIDWHSADRLIKELMGPIDGNNCYCFSVKAPEIREVYGSCFSGPTDNQNLLYALFAKNEKPVYQSIFPGENYEIISVLPKSHKLLKNK